MASQQIFCAFKRGTEARKFVNGFTYYSFVFASWIPALIFFNTHVGEVTTIGGSSMYPYLNSGFNEGTKDTCWVKKWNPLENLRRGMIVEFPSPSHPEKLAIKRVIAIEGDKVYTRAPYPFPIAEVPAGHVWVEGDNRDVRTSLDSNYYGPISMNLISGQVTYVLWPWRSSGSIRWWEFKSKTRVIKGS